MARPFESGVSEVQPYDIPGVRSGDAAHACPTCSGDALWVIVTPVLKPAPGGGAIYTDILARALACSGNDVLVVAERHEGMPGDELFRVGSGMVRQRRIFPHRAGRAAKDLRSYLAYAGANLIYFRLPSLIRRETLVREKAQLRILIHSSLLYYPNTLQWTFESMRRVCDADVLLIGDVRDFSVPDSSLPQLRRLDAIVTSSEKVAEELRPRLGASPPIAPIPMPFECPPVPTDSAVAETLTRLGLAGRPFLLNPNGINLSKHYAVMRDAIPRLRAFPGFDQLQLVTLGRDRDRRPEDDAAEARGETRYLGPRSHEEVLSLMRGALFTLVLSDREAISRAALEAMAVGGRVLLPDLPEFREECASHVVSQPTVEAVTDCIRRLRGAPMPRFGFERHLKQVFLQKYLTVGCGA